MLVTSLLGCAATAKHEGAGEYFDDIVLTTKVKSATLNEGTLKSSKINGVLSTMNVLGSPALVRSVLGA